MDSEGDFKVWAAISLPGQTFILLSINLNINLHKAFFLDQHVR